MALITFTTDTISLSIPVKKVSWPSTALDTQQLLSVRPNLFDTPSRNLRPCTNESSLRDRKHRFMCHSRPNEPVSEKILLVQNNGNNSSDKVSGWLVLRFIRIAAPTLPT